MFTILNNQCRKILREQRKVSAVADRGKEERILRWRGNSAASRIMRGSMM